MLATNDPEPDDMRDADCRRGGIRPASLLAYGNPAPSGSSVGCARSFVHCSVHFSKLWNPLQSERAISVSVVNMSTNISSRPTLGVFPAAGYGLIAGIVMAMVAMLATWMLGMGPFAPLAMIAGIAIGPEATMSPTPSVLAIGLMLHMVLSMMFGVVFALLAPRLRANYVALGAAYGVVLWLVNFYLLSFVSPGARAMATHEPVWLAITTHLMFGLVLGWLVERTARPSPGIA